MLAGNKESDIYLSKLNILRIYVMITICNLATVFLSSALLSRVHQLLHVHPAKRT